MPSRDDDGGWLRRLGAATATGRAVAASDWAATPVGPPGSWPVELRVAVQVCLTTRFPMLVMWGRDLRMIYNDGYRDMIGSKHPDAIGSPLAVVWAEIWDVIGPMTRQVIETGEPTWSQHQTLLMSRRGFLETTQFTFSYSPLIGADGQIVGIIDVATETTGQVLAQRRLACLSQLGTVLYDAAELTDVCVAAASALSGWREDVVNADVFLRVGDDVVLVASSRQIGRAPVDPKVLLEVMDRDTRRRFGPTAATPGLPVAGLALPLARDREGPDGVLYIEPDPTLALDTEFEDFLAAAATTIATALESAYRRAAEIGEHRRTSETLQAAMLQPVNDHPTIAARHQPATLNLAVGGDWYDVIDLDEHRRAMVIGDCVGHGLEAATIMGQLRTAARALLLEGHEPATVLEHLDVFAAAVPGAFATTVVCAVIDRARATVTYARAGHLPPLIVDAGVVRWLDQASGLPLQVATGSPRPQAVVSYTHGSLLVLYSDGLIERRGESLDIGLARLETVASDCLHLDVDEIADELLRRLLTNPEDDVVLVAKRLLIDTD